VDLFDAAEARAQRDAALERVADNAGDFMGAALATVARLPAGEWTGEQIRTAVLNRGIVPHHHNAWGALICAAVKQGLVVPTGRYVAMRARKSHARKTPVYARAA
jgi:hypothetical protein